MYLKTIGVQCILKFSSVTDGLFSLLFSFLISAASVLALISSVQFNNLLCYSNTVMRANTGSLFYFYSTDNATASTECDVSDEAASAECDESGEMIK